MYSAALVVHFSADYAEHATLVTSTVARGRAWSKASGGVESGVEAEARDWNLDRARA